MKVQNSPGSYGLLAGLLVLLLGLFANASCAMSSYVRDTQAALEQAVRIDVMCVPTADPTPGSLAMFIGSGVVVDRRTVMTAAHVASDPDGYTCLRTATMSNEHKYSVHAGVVRTDRDLATLVLDDPAAAFDPTYPVSYGAAPDFGARVCAMTSYPMWLWRCGEAQLTVDPPGDRIHTIVVEHGNSGSGVYDMSGRLVGIVTHLWQCSNGQLCGGKFSTLEGFTGALLRPSP